MSEQADAYIGDTVDYSTVFMSAKSDVIFKIFFGDEKNKPFLVWLLKSILDLPLDEYEDIQITDPHIKREYPGDKLSILDVKAKTKSGMIIHIEIQLYLPDAMEKRIVFYNSKLITEQLNSGDDYDAINRTYTIIIVGETLLKNHNKYHDRFIIYSPETQTQLTDVIEYHTLELPKHPRESDGTDLWNWLEFLKADSKEELAMLAQNSPQMQAPMEKLLEINQDPTARRLFEAREKERRDAISRERRMKREGIQEGIQKGIQTGERNKQFEIARNMLKRKMPIGDIMEITGLSATEMKELQ